MTTATISQHIEALLIPILFTPSNVTPAMITTVKEELRSLLGKIDVKDIDALLKCLMDIVNQRRGQRFLPSDIHRNISRYLSVEDAQKYLLLTKVPQKQREDQIKRRQKEEDQEYQKWIAQKKYKNWPTLIDEEYFKRGMSFYKLRRFMTAQKIPNELYRSLLWGRILKQEYRKKRMTMLEMISVMTDQNMSFAQQTALMKFLIEEEHKKGKSLHELIPFIMTLGPIYRSVLFTNLILKEDQKGTTPLPDLKRLITAQNMPDASSRIILWHNLFVREYMRRTMSFHEIVHALSTMSPGFTFHSWRYIFNEEHDRGTMPFHELISFLTAQNIPETNMRSIIWKDLLYKEHKKGTTPLSDLLSLVTAENIPEDSIRSELIHLFS